MFDIIDVYTQEIVGHHENFRCRTKEALKALEKAVDGIESFHGTLKREEIYQTYYQHITHCKSSIAEFIDRYNSDKPHSSIEDLAPVVYHERIVENMIAGVKFAA